MLPKSSGPGFQNSSPDVMGLAGAASPVQGRRYVSYGNGTTRAQNLADDKSLFRNYLR